MADTFFEDNNVEENQLEQPETIKLGEREYSQDELQRLVGLGEQAVELENKWDTKIDRLMPEYSRSREELKTLREQAQAQAQVRVEKKQEKGEELSPEEQAKLVKEELRKYGVMTEEEFDQKYMTRRAGEKLLERTEAVVASAVSEGKPKTSAEELITYMAETGVKDPSIAYEVMFKKQLREIEMQKLQSIKPQGIYTESASTAGAKQPSQVAVTRDNMGDLLGEILTRGGGQ